MNNYSIQDWPQHYGPSLEFIRVHSDTLGQPMKQWSGEARRDFNDLNENNRLLVLYGIPDPFGDDGWPESDEPTIIRKKLTILYGSDPDRWPPEAVSVMYKALHRDKGMDPDTVSKSKMRKYGRSELSPAGGADRIDRVILYATEPMWVKAIDNRGLDKAKQYMKRHCKCDDILDMSPTQASMLYEILEKHSLRYYYDKAREMGLDPSDYSDKKLKKIVDKWIDINTGKSDPLTPDQAKKLLDIYDSDEATDAANWFNELPMPTFRGNNTIHRLYDQASKQYAQLKSYVDGLKHLPVSVDDETYTEWEQLPDHMKPEYLPSNTSRGRLYILTRTGYRGKKGLRKQVADRLVEGILHDMGHKSYYGK